MTFRLFMHASFLVFSSTFCPCCQPIAPCHHSRVLAPKDSALSYGWYICWPISMSWNTWLKETRLLLVEGLDSIFVLLFFFRVFLLILYAFFYGLWCRLGSLITSQAHRILFLFVLLRMGSVLNFSYALQSGNCF